MLRHPFLSARVVAASALLYFSGVAVASEITSPYSADVFEDEDFITVTGTGPADTTI